MLIKDNLKYFNQKVEKMRKEYFWEQESKIKDLINDELSNIKQLIKNQEKENKNYLEKNNQKSFRIIKFTHYNNRYIYNELQENEKDLESKIINSNITLPELIRPEKDITLNKLIKYYNDSIKITKILPIFIKNALQKKMKIW